MTMYLSLWKRFTEPLKKKTRVQKSKRKSTPPPNVAVIVDYLPKHDSVISTTQVTILAPVATGQALIVDADRKYQLETAYPLPQIVRPDEVAIRNCAVGLNPIDWKSVAYNFCLPQLPWITGRESAGIVEEIGASVSGVEVGDRVWTSTYYKDIRAGCFQERIVVPAHTVLPIPEGISFEEAASFGVAGLTAAMTLYKWLGLRAPDASENPPETDNRDEGFLLIWGGSTVTGQWATQLAVLSNVRTICVCSKATEELSYACGATHVVCRDGKSTQTIVDEIRAIAGNRVALALDLVGAETTAACLEVVSKTSPVRVAALAAMPKAFVQPENVEIMNVEMKQFVLDRQNRAFAETLNRLIGSGQVRCPKLQVLEGGLAMVPQGLEMVKIGRLSGQRAVVKM